jgi:hypothetical protein
MFTLTFVVSITVTAATMLIVAAVAPVSIVAAVATTIVGYVYFGNCVELLREISR